MTLHQTAQLTPEAFEVLEELMDTDDFIRSYPNIDAYVKEWDRLGGLDAMLAPKNMICEFYAERESVVNALHTWFTYQEYQ